MHAELHFKKGESGNPPGRPRRSAGAYGDQLKAAIEEALSELVVVKIGDKKRRMPVVDAIGYSLVNRSIHSARDLRQLVRLLTDLGVQPRDLLKMINLGPDDLRL